MKKVLILSYFFPPANFAGSYRIYSFAQHLHENGYFPTIITRSWERSLNGCYEESIYTNEYFQAYHVKYNENLRDKLLERHPSGLFKIVARGLTFIELLFRNVFFSFVPYKNMLVFAREWLERNPDCTLVLTSGTPFQLFGFCHKLKREFPDIKWIADYRDEWTSAIYDYKRQGIWKFINRIDKYFEKKWIQNAEAIVSVSDTLSGRISCYTSKPGYTVMNGYEESDILNSEILPFKELTIVYNGTLYPSQPIELFAKAFEEIVNEFMGKLQIVCVFPGILSDVKAAKRVADLFSRVSFPIKLMPRISKGEVMELQQRAQLLLMVGHQDSSVTGILSSKIFEYLALKKPIILCPGDGGDLEQLIQKTKSGAVCNSIAETKSVLQRHCNAFLRGEPLHYTPDLKIIAEYSRQKQATKLAEVFNVILEGSSKVLPVSFRGNS